MSVPAPAAPKSTAVTDEHVRYLAGEIILRWVNHESDLGAHLLNTFHFDGFPDEVKAHIVRIGVTDFVPARVLALFALGRTRDIEPPEEDSGSPL